MIPEMKACFRRTIRVTRCGKSGNFYTRVVVTGSKSSMFVNCILPVLLFLCITTGLQATPLQKQNTAETDTFEPVEMEIEFEQEFEQEASTQPNTGFDQYPADAYSFDTFESDNASTDQDGLSSLLSSARFTLKHAFFYKIEHTKEVRNNRSSMRLEYSRALGDYFFVQLDLKQNMFWKNDHKAQVADQEVKSEFNSREIFLQASFGDTSIKIGEQILIWGNPTEGQ